METFEPLVELRGEWRQAAAISIPAAAARVAAALDRALDVLVDAEQVDEESLTMAAETVCKAVVARQDEVELLRRRLHRAIRDYVTVTAIDQSPMNADSGAFDSEEALAAALFASVGESIGEEEPLPEVAATPESTRRRIDEKALKKQLASDPGRTRRRITSLVMLLIPLGLVAVVLIYVLAHPDLFVRGVPEATATAGTSISCPSANAFENGCFQGSQAACPGGTPSSTHCDFDFSVSKGGAISLTLRWDTPDTLSIELLKSDGATVVAGPFKGTQDRLVLSAPHVAAGTYVVRVSNPAAGPNSIHFNVSTA